MPSQNMQLVGGFYSDDTRPWASQDCVNYLPVRTEAPGTRSEWMWRTAPGLKPFVQTGGGNIRGIRNVEGKLLVVSGTTLYQISNTGVAIPRGTIPGVGPVSMSHNQQGNANQVIIVNGFAGYIYNTSTLELTKITDAGYPGAKVAAYLASYFLQVEPGGRFWFHSDLADGFSYNTLDRYESEAAPDRIVTLAVSQLEVVVFNETTTEFFTNTGAATGTFQSKGIVIETGCAGTHAVAQLDNTLMWLDDKGVVQRMEGYSARPISTRVLERQIAKYKDQWSNVIAFTWEDKGHKVFYLTFPNGYTFGYDVTTGLWTRRQSWGMDRWRLSCLTYWNKQWIGGDFQDGKLYTLDWRYMYDGRDPYVRKAHTGFISNDQRRVSIPSAEILFNTGGTPEPLADFPAQPEPPVISGALPDGEVGLSWAGVTYSVTGGTPPYTITSRAGTTFPGNLGPMSSAGVVPAETPTTAGVGVNIPRATDANGLYDQLTDEFTIGVGPLVFAASVSSPSATILGSPLGDDFSYSIATGLGANVSRIHAAGGRVFVFDNVTAGRVSADNGATWESITGLNASGSQVNDVAHLDGVWIMVYQSGTIISRSTNGKDFTDVTVASKSRYSATAGDGVFLVGGSNRSLESSADGAATFSAYTLPLDAGGGATWGVESVFYNGTHFLATTQREDGIAYSATGLTGSWAFTPHPFGAGSQVILLGASGGRSFSASVTLTAYSDDPTTSWTAGGTTAVQESSQRKIASNANGVYLGAGTASGAMVLRTTTGATWADSVDSNNAVRVTAMDVLP